MNDNSNKKGFFKVLLHGILLGIKYLGISLCIFASLLYLTYFTFNNISNAIGLDFDVYLAITRVVLIISFIIGLMAFTSQFMNKPDWNHFTRSYKKAYPVYFLTCVVINIACLSLNDKLSLAQIETHNLLLYTWLTFIAVLILFIVLKHLCTCFLAKTHDAVLIQLNALQNDKMQVSGMDIISVVFSYKSSFISICFILIWFLVLFAATGFVLVPLVPTITTHRIIRFSFLFGFLSFIILISNIFIYFYRNLSSIETKIDASSDLKDTESTCFSMDDIIANKIEQIHNTVDDTHEADMQVITWLQELIKIIGAENIPPDYINAITEYKVQTTESDKSVINP